MQQPRDFSMAGAVDLGARQAAAKRREQASQPGETGATSAFVFEVTDATFNTDVVARSQSAPVIVDLWAEWCEPCKQLGPVLERLANEAAGDWLLAKVDVDANPQLAAALQVQSIPMVVAVIGGQLVDGFLGALPEPQVQQWINQILQVADQLGMPARVRQEAATSDQADAYEAEAGQQGAASSGSQVGPRGPGAPGPMSQAGPGGAPGPGEMLGDQRFEAVQDAMDAGDFDTAATTLEQVLADSPGHPVAKAWLAQVELVRRVNSYDRAKVNRSASEHPDDPDAQAKAADLELANGQVQESFDRLLGVFQRTAGDERDKVRKHLLELFEVLPPRDPRVTKARSKLSSLLF
jgi:putative thioredoxin